MATAGGEHRQSSVNTRRSPEYSRTRGTGTEGAGPQSTHRLEEVGYPTNLWHCRGLAKIRQTPVNHLRTIILKSTAIHHRPGGMALILPPSLMLAFSADFASILSDEENA
jgi:hypothetical protein